MSGPNEAANEPEGESLTGAAQEFHAWAEDAQQRDPVAKGPADDLWNRILEGRGRLHVDPVQTEWSDDDMGTAIHAPVADRVPPKSNRTKRAQFEASPSRSGGWLNAIAAALLLLSIGGGAYLARNGGLGFGEGGGDEGRYAAQVASPEASPTSAQVIGAVDFSADGVCEAEPLTADEVFEIVMNPLNGFAQRGIQLEEGTPEPLLEVPWQGSQQRPSAFPDPKPLHRASEGEAAAVDAFVTEYYECLKSGTSFQVWGLMTPYDVQSKVLSNFPVLRSEEQIRNYIEEFGPQENRATWPGQNYDYFFTEGYSIQGNPAPLSMWVNPNYAFPDVIILSGARMVDENGEVVAAVDYEGRPSVLQSGAPGVPETLEIAYFAETNTWYVSATYSLRG